MKAGFKLAVVVSAATLALVGCGGDSSTASSTTTPAADKYVGTWSPPCTISNARAADVNGASLYYRQTFTWAKVDANNLSGTEKRDYFLTGTTCTGTPTVTINYQSALKINSSSTIAGKAADAVTLSIQGPGGMSAVQNITVNGVMLPGNAYTLSGSTSGAMAADATTLYTYNTSTNAWQASMTKQ